MTLIKCSTKPKLSYLSTDFLLFSQQYIYIKIRIFIYAYFVDLKCLFQSVIKTCNLYKQLGIFTLLGPLKGLKLDLLGIM